MRLRSGFPWRCGGLRKDGARKGAPDGLCCSLALSPHPAPPPPLPQPPLHSQGKGPREAPPRCPEAGWGRRGRLLNAGKGQRPSSRQLVGSAWPVGPHRAPQPRGTCAGAPCSSILSAPVPITRPPPRSSPPQPPCALLAPRRRALLTRGLPQPLQRAPGLPRSPPPGRTDRKGGAGTTRRRCAAAPLRAWAWPRQAPPPAPDVTPGSPTEALTPRPPLRGSHPLPCPPGGAAPRPHSRSSTTRR